MESGARRLDAESFSLSCFLVAFIVSVMVLYHMLHCNHGGVKRTTARVVSLTTSIFAAVLCYGGIKSLLLVIIRPGFLGKICLTLALFVALYILTSAALFKIKDGSVIEMRAVGAIFAHTTGFAAMYGFSDLGELEIVEEWGATGNVLVVVIAVVVIPLMALAMDIIEDKIAMADGLETLEEKQWREITEDADDDVFSLAISFLVVGLFRYHIRGKILAYEPGNIGQPTQTECNYLLGYGMFFAFLVVVGAMLIDRFRDEVRNFYDGRPANVLQHLNTMVAAWCSLFWAEWQLHIIGWESTTIGSCLVIAMFFAFVSCCSVYGLDFLQHMAKARGASINKAVKSLELALGVLVGFSFERAFHVAFEEIALHAERHGYEWATQVVFIVMSGGIFAVVYSAWVLYILPQSLAEKLDLLQSLASASED